MSVTFFGWVRVGVGECDFYMARCGRVWVSVTFFLAGCEWVWVSVTFFLAGCEWVWVSVTFFWLGVGGCG